MKNTKILIGAGVENLKQAVSKANNLDGKMIPFHYIIPIERIRKLAKFVNDGTVENYLNKETSAKVLTIKVAGNTIMNDFMSEVEQEIKTGQKLMNHHDLEAIIQITKVAFKNITSFSKLH